MEMTGSSLNMLNSMSSIVDLGCDVKLSHVSSKQMQYMKRYHISQTMTKKRRFID